MNKILTFTLTSSDDTSSDDTSSYPIIDQVENRNYNNIQLFQIHEGGNHDTWYPIEQNVGYHIQNNKTIGFC